MSKSNGRATHPRGHPSRYIQKLENLKQRPKRWQVIGRFKSQGVASTVMWRLKHRHFIGLPRGRFEYTTKASGALYGRYLG